MKNWLPYLVTSLCVSPFFCQDNCSDIDSDGVCDEYEIAGCQDVNAVNYNPDATDSYYNLNESEPVPCYFLGCQDENALNYDPNANANGACDYPTYLLDWNYTVTDPMSYAVVAIININNLPELDSLFCDEVTVGAFYNNVAYNNGYVDGEFLGYSNGSSYNCLESDPYPFLSLYMNDNSTSVKDGFNVGEPIIFIVEINGIEYMTETSFPDLGIDMETIDMANFEPSGMYVINLNIIEPVQFGCTDSLSLSYDYNANLDNGSCISTDYIIDLIGADNLINLENLFWVLDHWENNTLFLNFVLENWLQYVD